MTKIPQYVKVVNEEIVDQTFNIKRTLYPATLQSPLPDRIDSWYKVRPSQQTIPDDKEIDETIVDLVDNWPTVIYTFKDIDKDKLLEKGREIRDAKILEGINVNGIVIRGDETTQLRLAGARIEAEADPSYTVTWKAENIRITLNATQIIALSSAMRANIQKCFDAFFEIEDEIDNITTYAQVQTTFDDSYNA